MRARPMAMAMRVLSAFVSCWSLDMSASFANRIFANKGALSEVRPRTTSPRISGRYAPFQPQDARADAQARSRLLRTQKDAARTMCARRIAGRHGNSLIRPAILRADGT